MAYPECNRWVCADMTNECVSSDTHCLQKQPKSIWAATVHLRANDGKSQSQQLWTLPRLAPVPAWPLAASSCAPRLRGSREALHAHLALANRGWGHSEFPLSSYSPRRTGQGSPPQDPTCNINEWLCRKMCSTKCDSLKNTLAPTAVFIYCRCLGTERFILGRCDSSSVLVRFFSPRVLWGVII